jgi:CheY-like chemotaxis protein
VVDDKAENRLVLRDLLTPLGFEITKGLCFCGHEKDDKIVALVEEYL